MNEDILKDKKTNNGSIQHLFDEGKEYIEKDEFQPAIKSFKRCINVDPDDSKAYVGLCIAYSGLMDLDTAREYYEELKELDPYLAAQLANTPTGNLLEQEDNNQF